MHIRLAGMSSDDLGSWHSHAPVHVKISPSFDCLDLDCGYPHVPCPSFWAQEVIRYWGLAVATNWTHGVLRRLNSSTDIK